VSDRPIDEPREDDRDEVAGSPIPDPTEEQGDAGDDPQAD
jgi:hypothetical protein